MILAVLPHPPDRVPLTRRARLLTVLLVAAIAMGAVSATPAVAAEPQPLWKAYPLGQTTPSHGTSGSAARARARRVAAPERAVVEAEHGGDSALTLVLAALAMAFLGLAALTWRALPRRRPVLISPPASAAERRKRTVTLWLSVARASAERARAAWRPEGGSSGAEPERPASSEHDDPQPTAAAAPPPAPDPRRLAPVADPASPSEGAVPLAPDAAPAPTEPATEPAKPRKRTGAERWARRLETERREREAAPSPDPEKQPDPPARRADRGSAASARTPSTRATPPARRGPEPTPERCAIVMERLGRTAEFRVVSLTGDDDPVAYVARTPSFVLRGFGVVPRWGRARKLHDGLVRQLADAGWVPAGAGGRAWYEAVFSRDAAPAHPAGEERCTVVLQRFGREARWEAVSVDAYGTATPVSASPAFPASRAEDPAGSEEAQALRAALLTHLERFGWEVANRPADPSSATTLRRSAR